MRLCSVPFCPHPHLAKGLCQRHYAKRARRGDPLVGRTNRKRAAQCWVARCIKPVLAKNLCGQHYQRAAKAKRQRAALYKVRRAEAEQILASQPGPTRSQILWRFTWG